MVIPYQTVIAYPVQNEYKFTFYDEKRVAMMQLDLLGNDLC
jgi:hypothetical protein